MRDADSLFLPVLVGGSVDQLASRHSGLRSTSSVLGFAQTKFVSKSFFAMEKCVGEVLWAPVLEPIKFKSQNVTV